MKSMKCPVCGLAAFASASACKRCGTSLEVSELSQVQSDQSDAELEKSISAKKGVIYMVGLFGSVALSIAAAVMTESTTSMIFLFGGILLVGSLWTWVVATKVESRMLGRRNIIYTITPAQRASVATSSVASAFIVLHNDYGWILSPLIIVIFNGALYLYERQMRTKRGAVKE